MKLFIFIVIATLIYIVSSACLACEFRMTAREHRRELHTFPLLFALTVFYFALVCKTISLVHLFSGIC